MSTWTIGDALDVLEKADALSLRRAALAAVVNNSGGSAPIGIQTLHPRFVDKMCKFVAGIDDVTDWCSVNVRKLLSCQEPYIIQKLFEHYNAQRIIVTVIYSCNADGPEKVEGVEAPKLNEKLDKLINEAWDGRRIELRISRNSSD